MTLTVFGPTQAWGRIAKALGPDFIPYLSVVMPPLLKSADIKPDVEVCKTLFFDAKQSVCVYITKAAHPYRQHMASLQLGVS